MNPKFKYSPALQEDARRFEERLYRAGDVSSFGKTVRNKRHAGVTCWSDMLELKTVLGGIV